MYSTKSMRGTTTASKVNNLCRGLFFFPSKGLHKFHLVQTRAPCLGTGKQGTASYSRMRADQKGYMIHGHESRSSIITYTCTVHPLLQGAALTPHGHFNAMTRSRSMARVSAGIHTCTSSPSRVEYFVSQINLQYCTPDFKYFRGRTGRPGTTYTKYCTGKVQVH
jgi:hypothetical protein